MQAFNSVNDFLDFAIEGEEEAHRFYLELAAKVDKNWVKKLLEEFAQEELGHKAKLEAVKLGRALEPSKKQILDLKIADYLVDVDPSQHRGLDYQQALIIAMKKEKAAFKFYNDLAAVSSDERLRATFLTLAQEEAKHKLRFEIEYDDIILEEN